MKIIVQAGGKGTRLKHLTHNRPKCLVPVNNLPIIFHLFKNFSGSEFIIIADYKADVLERYLRNFSKEKYKIVYSSNKGNISGIKDALQYIAEDEQFMLIWSDIMLSDDMPLQDLHDGNYIGILKGSPCSWSFINSNLEKKASNEDGVGGCFIFENKNVFKNISEVGSFTEWLKNSGIELKPFEMKNSIEVGTIDAIKSIEKDNKRCRPYNDMQFTHDKVIKNGITKEGAVLIDKEKIWYDKISKYGFINIPKIYDYNPLTMEKIRGENIFNINLSEKEKSDVLNKIINLLKILHNYEQKQADRDDIFHEYYTKTIDRLTGIKTVIPFADKQFITINGELCKNPLLYRETFKNAVEKHLMNTVFCPIHGDCTLTNMLIDNNSDKIYLIDPRGYFGKQLVFGDIRYDWAKLYYSIAGNFDRFNIKEFSLEIGENEIVYSIASNGWENLVNQIFSETDFCNYAEIKFIHAIIWLSLASHCWEDYDSMCLAFYNGTVLINEFLEGI